MLQIDGNFFACEHFDMHNILILGNNILVSIKEKLMNLDNAVAQLLKYSACVMENQLHLHKVFKGADGLNSYTFI